MKSTTKWKTETLAVEDVREHADHQVRAGGVSALHVNVLARAMEIEGDLAPIRCAKIGRALYVVDGFHRLAAARKLGWSHIAAEVAVMSAAEARDEARLANTRHGKGLSRYDKARLFDLYVAEGRHLGDDGIVKASRVIQAEVNHIYSHETIRTKLKERGIEMELQVEYPDGYKPRAVNDEGELEADAAEAANTHLERFGSLFFDLEDDARQRALEAARELVGLLERGERPVPSEPDGDDCEGVLDI